MKKNMKCPKCGADNFSSARFCQKCGNPLLGNAARDREKKSGSGVLTVLILFSMIMVIAMTCFIIYFRFDALSDLLKERGIISSEETGSFNRYKFDDDEDEYDKEDDKDDEEDEDDPGDDKVKDDEDEGTETDSSDKDRDEDNTDNESVPSEREEASPTVERSPVSTEDDRRFSIDPFTITDYEAAIYPEDYLHYSSGIRDFGFSYCPYLYNDADFDDTERAHDYGTLIQSVSFSGTDGSKLVFMLFKRNDSLSMEKAVKFVHDSETGRLQNPKDILNKISGGHGKVIVTGMDGSNAIYDMLKVRKNYILQMIVSHPEPTDDDDRDRKWYVTECYYRMCDFSDSSNYYRSFNEYLREQ